MKKKWITTSTALILAFSLALPQTAGASENLNTADETPSNPPVTAAGAVPETGNTLEILKTFQNTSSSDMAQQNFFNTASSESSDIPLPGGDDDGDGDVPLPGDDDGDDGGVPLPGDDDDDDGGVPLPGDDDDAQKPQNGDPAPIGQWLDARNTLVWVFGGGLSYVLIWGDMDQLGYWYTGVEHTWSSWSNCYTGTYHPGYRKYYYESYLSEFGTPPPVPPDQQHLIPKEPEPIPEPDPDPEPAPDPEPTPVPNPGTDPDPQPEPTPEPDSEADKETLKQLVEKAMNEYLLPHREIPTEELTDDSYNAIWFSYQYGTSVLSNSQASQAEVDYITADLANDMANAQTKHQVSARNLSNLLNTLHDTYGDDKNAEYTEDTWIPFYQMYMGCFHFYQNRCQSPYSDGKATFQEIDSMIELLKQAEENLITKKDAEKKNSSDSDASNPSDASSDGSSDGSSDEPSDTQDTNASHSSISGYGGNSKIGTKLVQEALSRLNRLANSEKSSQVRDLLDNYLQIASAEKKDLESLAKLTANLNKALSVLEISMQASAAAAAHVDGQVNPMAIDTFVEWFNIDGVPYFSEENAKMMKTILLGIQNMGGRTEKALANFYATGELIFPGTRRAKEYAAEQARARAKGA